ncbi:unnamed protein product [marine sediment metagenome]|uniref:PPM-type phosphatase domain-containing protein n=1 Tax=marine sediment metagenome TaxID=412755 RepID=X0WWU1_9ZZZZ
MFYGEFDPLQKKLCYCNAGHNYPLVVHEDGDVEFLITGGLILGAFAEAEYEVGEITLRKNDTLFFYSDGLTENFNANDEEFGEKRLLNLLLENRTLGAEDLIGKAIREVADFSGGRPPLDDFTIVVLKLR